MKLFRHVEFYELCFFLIGPTKAHYLFNPLTHFQSLLLTTLPTSTVVCFLLNFNK